MTVQSTYTPREMKEFCNISYRQTQYWTKTIRILKPRLIPTNSKLGRKKEDESQEETFYRHFTPDDVIIAGLARYIRTQGISMQAMEKWLPLVRPLVASQHPKDTLEILIEKNNEEQPFILVVNGPLTSPISIYPGLERFYIFGTRGLFSKEPQSQVFCGKTFINPKAHHLEYFSVASNEKEKDEENGSNEINLGTKPDEKCTI